MHQQQRRAPAAGDYVLAQVAGVDVPAGERAGEPFREVWCPCDRAWALRDGRRVHEGLLYKWYCLFHASLARECSA